MVLFFRDVIYSNANVYPIASGIDNMWFNYFHSTCHLASIEDSTKAHNSVRSRVDPNFRTVSFYLYLMTDDKFDF